MQTLEDRALPNKREKGVTNDSSHVDGAIIDGAIISKQAV